MPVTPAYGGGNGNGFGGFGGDSWGWIILLILLAGGNGFGGFGGYGGFANAQLGYDFPWLLNGQNNINANTNNGFRDAMLNDGITSLRDGISGISTQLCNGFAGTTATITGAQNALAQQLYTNQIADMQQNFALQSALANCCCDNKVATLDLKGTVISENCADRAALSDGIRDVIESNTRNTQAILDKLCDQELQAERRENANLRSQLAMKDLAASQTAQTARLLADNAAQTAALEGYLAPNPRPAYIVQNPNCCTPVYGGCGCGCGSF
jgi:uncharacterized phage infection (PIP) family protein YhgE